MASLLDYDLGLCRGPSSVLLTTCSSTRWRRRSLTMRTWWSSTWSRRTMLSGRKESGGALHNSCDPVQSATFFSGLDPTLCGKILEKENILPTDKCWGTRVMHFPMKYPQRHCSVLLRCRSQPCLVGFGAELL